ncbi:site-2 protease family protein [candidate division KSB1 bacterium]|nr:site-2 protease family protein [candidate division KSB1 bacterium]
MDYPRFYDTTTTGTNYNKPNKLQYIRKLVGSQPRINLILLVLTLYTTWLVHGISYAITIVTILLSHEMGHFLMCRRYRIRATLPFFIPLPIPYAAFNPFGTMGAVIRIEERMPNRKALFDIGSAGPIAGLILTIPALIIGLKLSTIVQVSSHSPFGLIIGDSLFFKALSFLIVGHVPDGYDIVLHPVAFAGWAGLFVTALNLLPLGQLDGGHVVYAMFGPRTNVIYKIVLSLFIAVCVIYYQGWLFLILLLIWFGYRHPPPIDDFTPIDKRRRIIGYIILFIFVISFTPVPFLFNN